MPIAIIDAKTKNPGTIFDVRIRDLSKLYAPQWAAFRPAPLLILDEILDARTNRGRTLERRTLLAISVDRANSYQVLLVNLGATLTLNDLTIANGSSGYGGGIYNDGTLTVTNSTFSGNSASTSFSKQA